FQAEDGIRDFHVTGVQTCALPISVDDVEVAVRYSPRIARWVEERAPCERREDGSVVVRHRVADPRWVVRHVLQYGAEAEVLEPVDRKSTRLNSSHVKISYAVFCLK